jgi:hypothetical protein
MKAIYYQIILFVLFASCTGSNKPDSTENTQDQPPPVTKSINCNTCLDHPQKAAGYGWFSDADNCGNIILYRGSLTDSIKNIEEAIARFNGASTLRIQKIGEKKDTLVVKLIHSEIYTQQMGTHGANEYMLSMIYSLTDHYGFNFVDVRFEEGDHGGQPGVFSRNKTGVGKPGKICE